MILGTHISVFDVYIAGCKPRSLGRCLLANLAHALGPLFQHIETINPIAKRPFFGGFRTEQGILRLRVDNAGSKSSVYDI
jgi:hypothetical protein